MKPASTAKATELVNQTQMEADRQAMTLNKPVAGVYTYLRLDTDQALANSHLSKSVSHRDAIHPVRSLPKGAQIRMQTINQFISRLRA